MAEYCFLEQIRIGCIFVVGTCQPLVLLLLLLLEHLALLGHPECQAHPTQETYYIGHLSPLHIVK